MNSKLGKTIKSIRTEKGYSIKDLANQIGVSSSLLSQIERNLTNPSLNTLREISSALDVPMFSLFLDESISSSMIVRKNDRTSIQNANTEEATIELLSPDLQGDIQMCSMVLAPLQYSASKMHSHTGEEIALCNKGSIVLHLVDEDIVLKQGDSVRVTQGVKHRWSNPGKENCELIFAITPPSY